MWVQYAIIEFWYRLLLTVPLAVRQSGSHAIQEVYMGHLHITDLVNATYITILKRL
jgi:hypothetical protein